MATPFGLFLYSFYLPILDFARKSELTAWVAAFFLPHSVAVTNSSFIELLRWLLPILFLLGLVGFLVFATQLYLSKFLRKGVVNSFIYSYIRHPQYLFFILAGLGILGLWPRMMMLVFFLLMSIFYFYLAKFEERRMLAAYPEYSSYMKDTAMFIPGNPGGKLFALLFGWIPNRKVAELATVSIVCIVVLLGAVGLRNHTINNISFTEIPAKSTLAIAIFPRPDDYLREVINEVTKDSEVAEILEMQGDVTFTAHVLPRNYGMLGMFIEIEGETDHIRRREDRSSIIEWVWGTESDQLKIIFSRIDQPDKKRVPLNEVFDMSSKMTPVIAVDINLDSGKVVRKKVTSTTHYGSVPMPIF